MKTGQGLNLKPCWICQPALLKEAKILPICVKYKNLVLTHIKIKAYILYIAAGLSEHQFLITVLMHLSL